MKKIIGALVIVGFLSGCEAFFNDSGDYTGSGFQAEPNDITELQRELGDNNSYSAPGELRKYSVTPEEQKKYDHLSATVESRKQQIAAQKKGKSSGNSSMSLPPDSGAASPDTDGVHVNDPDVTRD